MFSPVSESRGEEPLSRDEIKRVLEELNSPEACSWFAARCVLRALPLAIGGRWFEGREKRERWQQAHGKSLVAAIFAAFFHAQSGVDKAKLLNSPGHILDYAIAARSAVANARLAAYPVAYAVAVASASAAASVALPGYSSAAAAATSADYASASASAVSVDYAAAADAASSDAAAAAIKLRKETGSDIELIQSHSLAELLQLPLWNAGQPSGWSAFQNRVNQVFLGLDANLPTLLRGLEEGKPDWAGIQNWLQAWFDDYQQQQATKQAADPVTAEHTEVGSEKARTQRLALASLQQTRAETLATVDCLNRNRIVVALRQLITEREGDQHFALGLFGYWGSGKSSTIEQLKEQLGEQPQRIAIAEFNAWKNEKASNLAAMLAQTVVERLSSGLGIFGKLRLAMRLSVKRRARLAGDLKQDAGKVFAWLESWGWLALPPLLSVMVVGLLIWAIPIADGQWLEMPLKLLIGVGVSIALAYKSLAAFLKDNLTEFFKQVGVERPASLLQLPSYTDQRGLLGEIHLTLKALCELRLGDGEGYAGKQLLLVVDDLDRCGINAVKEVLDAVRLVADIPGVMTLVAIDERMAFAAVEKHYDQFGHAGRPPAQVAREYLAKVLQASIALPEVGEAEIDGYVEQVLFPGVERFVAEMPAEVSEVGAEIKTPEADAVSQAAAPVKDNGQAVASEQSAEAEASAPPTGEPPKLTPPIDLDSVQARALPEEVALFRSLATAYGFGNPRLLWRLHLSWRLLKSLYLGSGVYQFEQIELLMRLFFWREYYLQQEAQQRVKLQDWLTAGCRSEEEGPQHLVAALGRLKGELLGTVLAEKWEKIQALVDAVLLPASSHLSNSDAKVA